MLGRCRRRALWKRRCSSCPLRFVKFSQFLLQGGADVSIDVGFIPGGQIECVLQGPAIVRPVRGGDVLRPTVDLCLGQLSVGSISSNRHRTINRIAFVDVADALFEKILIYLSMLKLGILHVIEAVLGDQDGLDGAVLVDDLLLQAFGSSEVLQAADAVVLALLLLLLPRAELLVVVKVSIWIRLVESPDGSERLLYGLFDAFVIVFGVVGH
mmetsp:Transcript_22203/g.63704  ORF Transcript_22203/g.63704 Transcript_22203/m.63704 type:complete len:212 (+) Transcript_22203:180-815(+)